MPLRIPNEGESQALNITLGKTAVENLILKLYTNNITPSEADTAATYTEASGFGYAAVTLTAANWTTTESNPTSSTYPEITFSFTGALGNVYGYYVVGATSNRVRWAERFSTAPLAIANSGDQIKITLNVTLADTVDP